MLEADFSINLVRRTGVKSGDRITVSLPHDRIRIFPPRNAHG
jgi:iron(III) transport system ATP-binding protein